MGFYERARTKTRNEIVDAYFRCAEEDPQRITVGAISNKAGIHRTTFYVHFDSLDTLRKSVREQQLDEIRVLVAKNTTRARNYSVFLAEVSAYFQANAPALRLLLRGDLDPAFAKDFRAVLTEGLRSDMGYGHIAAGTKQRVIVSCMLQGMIEIFLEGLLTNDISLEEAFALASGIAVNGVGATLERDFGIQAIDAPPDSSRLPVIEKLQGESGQ